MKCTLPDGNILSFRYVHVDNPKRQVAAITGWEKVQGSLCIPEKINNKNVEIIEDSAFKHCLHFNDLYIPDSVKFILPEAFNGCGNLKTIRLSNSLTSIQSYSFNECGIEELIIPDNITAINSSAFRGCFALKNVVTGKNLRKIFLGAFDDCPSLQSFYFNENLQNVGSSAAFLLNCPQLKKIEVHPKNSDFSSIDGVLFSKNKNILIRYPQGRQAGTYRVPDSVTHILNYAFYGAKINSIKLHENIVHIASKSFDGIDFEQHFHIKCPSGTYAESYAKEHNLNYKISLSQMESFFINSENVDFTTPAENSEIDKLLR